MRDANANEAEKGDFFKKYKSNKSDTYQVMNAVDEK
jgi:hypothetical protein